MTMTDPPEVEETVSQSVEATVAQRVMEPLAGPDPHQVDQAGRGDAAQQHLQRELSHCSSQRRILD